MKHGPAPSVSSKIYDYGLRTWNDAGLITEGAMDEQTVGVLVKASDLLSRSRAMIKSSKTPIAKRHAASAKKPAAGKKKPCKIA